VKFNKANLMVKEVASKDPADPGLAQVHFARDGSSVSANGWALLAVSPIDKEKAESFPDMEEPNKRPPKEGVGIPTRVINDVLRNMPHDTRPQLQYVQLTKCSPARVELMTTDGDGTTKIGGRPIRGKFPKWQDKIAEVRDRKVKARVCIDRRRLIAILQAMDKACPDPGNLNPVYLEIGGETDQLYLRAENYESGQRAVGIVAPIDTRGQWIEDDDWEDELGTKAVQVRREG